MKRLLITFIVLMILATTAWAQRLDLPKPILAISEVNFELQADGRRLPRMHGFTFLMWYGLGRPLGLRRGHILGGSIQLQSEHWLPLGGASLDGLFNPPSDSMESFIQHVQDNPDDTLWIGVSAWRRNGKQTEVSYVGTRMDIMFPDLNLADIKAVGILIENATTEYTVQPDGKNQLTLRVYGQLIAFGEES